MQEPDYNRLQALATAYRQSALLFAAIELGVFAHVNGEGATAEQLASALALDAVPAGLLLNGLTALGILEREDGRYRLVSDFGVLAPGEGYFGDQLMLHKVQNESWLQLADILRGRHQGPSFESQLLQSDRVPSYLDSIEKANRLHADQLIARLLPWIERADRILDIGGGHGYYARKILAETANASVTIMDLDRAIDYARQRLADLLPTQRLELIVGDALTHTTRDGFDMVMVNDVLHYFDGARQQEILTRAAGALREDGMLVISKFRLSADGTEPTQASLFSLKMYVNTLSGYLATDQETADQLRALDLRAVRVLDLGTGKTVVAGRR